MNLKLIVEGEEETVSHLNDFVYANPEMFQADAFIVADMGNLAPGEPAVTSTLRGHVHCIVEVRRLTTRSTRASSAASRLTRWCALIRMLATLHDDDGEVAVKGLHSFDWAGRRLSGGDVPLDFGDPRRRAAHRQGHGRLAAVVQAIDYRARHGRPVGRARPRTSFTRAQGADRHADRAGAQKEKEIEILMKHLQSVAPWGVHVKTERGKVVERLRGRDGAPGAKRRQGRSRPTRMASPPARAVQADRFRSWTS